jgi:uncharacterized protein (TIGR02001 family)
MLRLVVATIVATAVAPVHAVSLSSTITLASDYLFDGVSQTQGDSGSEYFHPALQASLDFEWQNGVYAGIWASNVDFGSYEDPEGSGVRVRDPADIELNLSAGYAWETATGFGFDLGLVHYMYTGAPSTGHDYTELYFGTTLPGGTTLTAFAADDSHVFGGFAWRLKATQAFALGEDWSLRLEATRTDYPEVAFWHGQVGVARAAGPFEFYLGYSDTDLRGDPRGDGRFLFTLSTTLDIF